MTRQALTRAVTSHALVVVAVLLVGAGIAAGALVGFSAETQTQTSTYAGGWLAAPTSLQTPAVRGNGATLTWTPATHDVAAQSIYGSDMGTTNSGCGAAAYATAFDTGLAANATTVNDDRGGSASGHWVCYQARSEHGSWNKTANFPSIVQVGLVPTGITVTNGSSSGQSSIGDTIDLAFNQSIAYSGNATITVCVFTGSNTILIGDSGCASASDTPTIGKITGLSIPNANRVYELSTVALQGTNTLRVTLNTATNGSNNRTAVTGTGTFTYTGSATIIQSSQGPASVCTAANCTWSWSGAF